MPPRNWPIPDWLLDAERWLVELVDGATIKVESINHAELVGSFGRIQIINRPTRFGFPDLVDPTIRIAATRGGQYGFFDTGEWLTLLDGHHATVRGEEQLVLFERRAEIERAQETGALKQLRRARDAWVTAEGTRALHGDTPEWPVGVDRPPWMTELDAALNEAGFESGWTVMAGADHPIGIVRQRGPLRVQLTVLDDRPLVQFAVWPHCSWRPFPVVARWTNWGEEDPERLGPVAVIEVGARFADMVFDQGSGPRWSSIQRIKYEKQIHRLGLGTGPGEGSEYFRFTDDVPSINTWLTAGELEDPFDRYRNDPERVGGGQLATLNLKNGKSLDRLPPILNRFGNYVVDAEMRTIVEQFALDALFFEFFVEGVPLYDVRFPRSAMSSVPDFVRSIPGGVGGTALWEKVVDPRQTGRPGHITPDDNDWFFDHRFKEALTSIVGDSMIRSTWDREGAIRLKATGYPTPEQLPREYR